MIIHAPDNKLFFITGPTSAVIWGTGSPDRLYQHPTSALARHASSEEMRELGNSLVIAAEQAHLFRQLNTLDQIRRALLSLPLTRPYRSVARYYEALRLHDFGRGDLDRAEAILERVVGHGPPPYRVRALLSLAAIAHCRRDKKSVLWLYSEASRLAARGPALDWCGVVRSSKMLAAMSGINGDHRAALQMLEGLLPLATRIRSPHPHAYFDYLNSLAVELMEANRLEEAHNVSNMVLASPFAPVYPEWRETYDDIAIRRYRTHRSLVYLNQRVSAHDNLVPLRAWRPPHGPLTTDAVTSGLAQARILDYASCRDKMRRKEPSIGDDARGVVEEMSERELMVKIMELAATDGLQEEDLRRMVHALESIIRERGVS